MMFNTRRITVWVTTASMASLALLSAGPTSAQPHDYRNYTPEPLDWAAEEEGILENHVQLTFDEDFHKAGEQYFSPDMEWVIFQAVPKPPEGEEPDPHYSMYVAKFEHNENGRITGIEEPIRVSPEGSANTCGFFHPQREGHIIFGSTVVEPSPTEPPGFQRQSSKYVWMFPPEMEIVSGVVPRIVTGDGSSTSEGRVALTPITENDVYDAECAYSPDGRFIVYGSVQSDERAVDLFVYDTLKRESTVLVSAPGYDGGPFFSPDGRRICYRSDRDQTNLLQLFVADLAFDDSGAITGIEREYQLTNNTHVNWGPYWHPDGRHIVYATSEIGHHNYEVFIVDADPGTLEDSPGPVRYGTNQRRVTHANGFDGLPVFSPDGQYMIWTSQREADPTGSGASQIWLAEFVMPLDSQRQTPGGYDPSQHSTSEDG